jgi:hypothetical protein
MIDFNDQIASNHNGQISPDVVKQSQLSVWRHARLLLTIGKHWNCSPNFPPPSSILHLLSQFAPYSAA